MLIRGGGIVGQTLALLLARDRLKVALLAQPRPAGAGPDVRAYAINAAARELLRSVRAWPDEAAAMAPAVDGPTAVTPVSAMAVQGDTDGALHFSATEQGAEALGWIVDVPALEQRLAHAVHFQAGISRVDEAPAKVALTVVCEGRRSATRAELGIDYDTRPTRTRRWRRACAAPGRTAGWRVSGSGKAKSWRCCRWKARRGTPWPWCGLYRLSKPMAGPPPNPRRWRRPCRTTAVARWAT